MSSDIVWRTPLAFPLVFPIVELKNIEFGSLDGFSINTLDNLLHGAL